MSEGITGATTDTATAAPSPAPAPAGNIDDALEQSFAASLTPASAPDATDPATPEGEAPATVEPPQEPVAPVATPDSKEGPIPFAVHKTALENARKKAVEEIQAQYGPVAQFMERFQADPVGTVRQLQQELEAHPLYGPQLQSQPQAVPRHPNGQFAPRAVEDTRPEPDLQTADGALVYSASQLQKLDEWKDRQWEQKLQAAVSPFAETQKAQKARETLARMQQQEWQNASALIAELKADPDFEAHMADVKQRMADDPKLSIDRAWQRVYREVVTPKKVAQQQQQWLSQAAKKSQGSSPDPAASAPAQPRRPRTVDEGLDQIFDNVHAS